MEEPKIQVVRFRMHDTGIGREAGYDSDEELVAAAQAQRAEAEALLTPEALAKIDAAEREFERRILEG